MAKWPEKWNYQLCSFSDYPPWYIPYKVCC